MAHPLVTHPLLDLPYGPEPAQRLDLYLPAAAVPRPLPVVLFLHGGGWAGGDKRPCPAVPLAAEGFAVASVNYRLSGTAPFPAPLHDVKGAVRWLRSHAAEHGLDGTRIGVWGISAGAHLAALLGLTPHSADLAGTVGDAHQPTDVRAVCDWFGPTDLAHFEADARTAAMAPKPQWPLLTAAFLGRDDPAAVAAVANPVRHVTPAAPPFLIQHGDRDDWVPLGQSRRLADALSAAGVRHTFAVVRDAGHGPGFDAPAVRATVIDFFRRTL